MSQFSSLGLYDVPREIAEQVIDNEVTMAGLRRLAFEPSKLSIAEREGFVDRLKEAAGRTAVGDALIGVATNPLTWLFFATAPWSGDAAAGAAFRGTMKLSQYVRNKAPWLASVGAMSPGQVFRQSESTAAALRIAEGRQFLQESVERKEYIRALHAVVERNGLDAHKGLDWKKYGNLAQRDRARYISSLWFAKQHGVLDDVTRYSIKVKDGIPSIQEEVQKSWAASEAVREGVERKIDSVAGLRDLVAATDVMTRQFPTIIENDPQAALRLIRGLAEPRKRAMIEDAVGKDTFTAMLQQLDGADLSDPAAVEKAADVFRNTILRTQTPAAKGGRNPYVPKNVVETRRNGQPLTMDQRFGTTGRGITVRPDGSQVPVDFDKALQYDYDDLDFMLKRVLDGRASETFSEQFQEARRLRGMEAEGKMVSVARIAPEQAFERYANNTANTYALFIQDVGDEVRFANSTTVSRMRKEGVKHRVPDPSQQAGWSGAWRTKQSKETGWAPIGSFDESIEELERTGRTPIGGFTVADVVQKEIATSDRTTRGIIEHVLLPRSLGRVGEEHAATMATLLMTKAMAKGFASTPVAKAIEQHGGELGGGFIRRLREYADVEVTPAMAAGALRHGSSWLYASHLGFNVASVLINLTQPFVLAAAAGRLDDLAMAYADTFSELGGYLKKRASQGFKVLTPGERDVLYKQSFSMANHEGHNLVGIGSDVIEDLQGYSLRSELALESKDPLWKRMFVSAPLALFEKGEIINRNVTAHMMRRSYERRGLAARGPAFRMDTREMVQRTQFGGHWMNTPVAFLTGKKEAGVVTGDVLSNPLIRQFLTFPVRMLTSVGYDLANVADRGGLFSASGAGGALKDVARLIGLSAIMYEVSRATVGADVTKGGFVASVTDLVPGFSQGRWDATNDTLPIPPVLDIPISLFQGVLAGDRNLLGESVARLLPGGVAFRRAINVGPDLPEVGVLGGLPGLLQRTYVDWETTNEVGNVAIRQADGSLMDFRSPTELIMRGLGVDVGRWGQGSDLDRWLTQNREEIVRYKREYIRHALGGDQAKADSWKREFERRFKIPLVVTEQQVEQFRIARETPRPERIVDRMPPEVRDHYLRALVSTRPDALAGDPAQWGAETARARAKERLSQRPLSEETRALIQEAQEGQPPFSSFGAF